MSSHSNNEKIVNELIDSKIKNFVFSKPAHKTNAQKIRIRPICLKSGLVWQFERFKNKKVFHENFNPEELAVQIKNLLKENYQQIDCTGLHLSIKILKNKKGQIRIIRKQHEKEQENKTALESDLHAFCRHNKKKNYILQEGVPVPFLVDLGVMTSDGKIVASLYNKFRQINKFLEFIQDLLPEIEAIIKEKNQLRIIDIGCGKSYLTFAVYYYLRELKKINVDMIGLDLKRDLIKQCSFLAKKYAYNTLQFETGDIGSYIGKEQPDMVISLHACDTASDYVLARAVKWNARIILCVPCCQHEINSQLGLSIKDKNKPLGQTVLASAFRFGIVRERIAALLTDVMRAELLEEFGYKVQIMEFIDIEHTAKNLLIRAIKTSAKKTKHQERLSSLFGLKHSLEKELGV